MDFFERQDKARKNTRLLVFYFIAAVVLLVGGIYLACLFIFQGIGSTNAAQAGRSGQQLFLLWNPQVFLFSAGGTLGVIILGSLFKTAELSHGGGVVARSLGGRLLDTNATDPSERRLLNIVEEMALASGISVPEVYLLDEEQGINAFAAGNSPADAAVGVTRGCLNTLSRDELQGVIAHEFSHILNGDMRLNLRLMGIIFGIVCLTVIGRVLLRSGARGRYHLGARNKGGNPLPLLGLVLIALGWVGVLFGRLIQAAVSRQREFLADSAAVQFTRNPGGISGALQKIGAIASGSKIQSPHAEEASHMFFGSAMGGAFLNSFATHPPLAERIRAIDPQWDGTFHAPKAVMVEPAPLRAARSCPPTIPIPPIPGMPGAAGFAPQTVRPQAVMINMGRPTPMHLRYAEELRDSFPESIRNAARDPVSAVALIYSLLLSSDDAVRASQMQGLAERTTTTLREQVGALSLGVAAVTARARLPLVELAMPALKHLGPDEYQQFTQTLQWLMESDEQLDLFEFVLQKIIRRQIDPHFTNIKPPVAQYYSIKPLAEDGAVLLSALAHVGHTDAAEINNAYQKGLSYLRAPDAPNTVLVAEACGLEQIDAALNRMALAVPQIKKNLIEAAVNVIGADGSIHEHEAELLRAIADTLDCPIPPFVTME